MVFSRKLWSKEDELPTQQPLLHLHHKIQTQFSDIVHRIGNLLMAPRKVNDEHDYALSDAEIKSRMAGIPIYKLSNYFDCHAGLFSHADPKRRLKLNFLSKPDALNFYERMKLTDDWPETTHGPWRIFDSPLSDVVVYGGKNSIVRLVPESSQIKNALEEKKKKDMMQQDLFSGVPVFKCDDLFLKIKSRGNTSFRPVYLRKEDLQDTITAMNILPGNIEVASLEEIIQEMKDSSTNKSNDLIFVGPGDTTNWLKA